MGDRVNDNPKKTSRTTSKTSSRTILKQLHKKQHGDINVINLVLFLPWFNKLIKSFKPCLYQFRGENIKY